MRLLRLLMLVLPLAATSAMAYDYPTDARVKFVIDCMQHHGGAGYVNLSNCSCSIDHIAQQMSFDEYVEADTYTRGRHAAGERAEVLREGHRASEMRQRLKSIKQQAAGQCFVHSGSTTTAKQHAASTTKSK